jgi:hypothetical protein
MRGVCPFADVGKEFRTIKSTPIVQNTNHDISFSMKRG